MTLHFYVKHFVNAENVYYFIQRVTIVCNILPCVLMVGMDYFTKKCHLTPDLAVFEALGLLEIQCSYLHFFLYQEAFNNLQ